MDIRPAKKDVVGTVNLFARSQKRTRQKMTKEVFTITSSHSPFSCMIVFWHNSKLSYYLSFIILVPLKIDQRFQRGS